MAIDQIINQTLANIEGSGAFGKVNRRLKIHLDNLDNALKVVTAIGRQRTPLFRIDDFNRFAYVNMIKWLNADDTMQALDPDTKLPVKGRLNAGIYVAGATGTGKSWLLEIMAALCTVDNPTFSVGNKVFPLRWKCVRADEIADEFSETGSISRFKRMPSLAIQDLGSEPRESMYMGNRLSVIGNLIEFRGDRDDLITLISSNYPLGHEILEQAYGSRVASRLRSMCNYFEMKGNDRRITNSKPQR